MAEDQRRTLDPHLVVASAGTGVLSAAGTGSEQKKTRAPGNQSMHLAFFRKRVAFESFRLNHFAWHTTLAKPRCLISN
jgi:hypothetical protein